MCDPGLSKFLQIHLIGKSASSNFCRGKQTKFFFIRKPQKSKNFQPYPLSFTFAQKFLFSTISQFYILTHFVNAVKSPVLILTFSSQKTKRRWFFKRQFTRVKIFRRSRVRIRWKR